MSFTATLQRGVDSCEAVKNHMVCATAPASAELGSAAEPSARHGEGAGGAFAEGCEHTVQKLKTGAEERAQSTARTL